MKVKEVETLMKERKECAARANQECERIEEQTHTIEV